MRITANQVTFVRLLLLPVPVAMVYRGGVGWMLGALAVYIVLGLTDALDGLLARRYGSTPLGALLDPIVDKIFLVAVYLPLADLRVVSTALAALIFVRELGVTVLRSIAFEERVAFRTSAIAKLKTTVQMAAGGFLLLVWLFPNDAVILRMLGFAAAAAAVPMALSLARGRRPGWRALWGAGLIGSCALGRLLLDRDGTLLMIMVVVLAFTLLSGAEYAWRMRAALARRFRRAPLEAVRLAAQSLAIPLLLLPAVGAPSAPVFVIMGLLAAELAVGGLDNSLVRAGAGRGPWPDLLRSASQSAAGVALLALLGSSSSWMLLSSPVWAALAVTLGDLTARFLRHVEVFRAG